MLTHRNFLLTLLVISSTLFAATTASAATNLGSTCVASASLGASGNAVQASVATGGVNYVVPSAGVITKWGANVVPYPGGITGRLTVVNESPAGTYTVRDASGTQPINSGNNIFDVRIPVSAGEQIGTFGALGILVCPTGNAGDVTNYLVGPVGDPGTVFSGTTPAGSNHLALHATLEPDVDGDGFGDETQDFCPQSASFQIVCPTPVIKRFIVPGASSLRVLLTTTVTGPVTLSGTAKVPKIGKKKGKTIKFKAVKRTITAGDLGNINIKYPSALKSAIKAAPKSAKIKIDLKLTQVGVLKNTVVPVKLTVRGTK